jgi:uncharacterized protein (TIGR02145 family)
MKSKLIRFGLFAVILFCFSPFSFTQTNCESARKEYLEKNPDVKNVGIDPWSHFNYYGKKEGRIWPSCSENIKSSTKIMNYVNDYVQIGDQYWTNTNLNVSVFNNGDTILCVKDAKSWQNACYNRKSAWCYFNFDPSTEKKFGKLYNLWAVIDPRGINPNGWHIPTKEDWIKLLEKNGNSFQNFPSANAMRTDNIEKYKTSNGWDKYSEFINGKQIYHESNGTNSTLLSVCPSGRITFEGSFDKPNLRAEFWTSTVAPSTPNGSPCYFSVELQDNRIYIQPSLYATGLSIRCISNDTPPTIPTTSTETKQNDIISYTTPTNTTSQTEKISEEVIQCTFKFAKPTSLTYKYIDNRKYCCYCNKKYAGYETRSKTLEFEQALYLAEKLYLHFNETGAEEAHKAADNAKYIKFFMTLFPGDDYFTELINLSQKKMAFFQKSYSGTLGSTSRQIEKYKLTSNFCSPECKDKCSKSSSCKCD